MGEGTGLVHRIQSHGNGRGRVLVCWSFENWEEWNLKLQSDCRFSAFGFDAGKKEPDSNSRDGVEEGQIWHTPRASVFIIPWWMGNAYQTGERSWWGKEESLLSFKVLIYILTPNLLPVPQMQFNLKSLKVPWNKGVYLFVHVCVFAVCCWQKSSHECL